MTTEVATEVQRLLRRQRAWIIVALAGLILSLTGYLPVLFKRKADARVQTELKAPDFCGVRPNYIKNFYVEPDGMGFRVAFALADEKGDYSVRGGRAYVSVVDDRYGYSGQELVTVKRDSFAFTSGEFLIFSDPATSPSGVVMPISPPRRIALEKAAVSVATMGCYVQLCYITPDGDTLRARQRTSWPWN